MSHIVRISVVAVLIAAVGVLALRGQGMLRGAAPGPRPAFAGAATGPWADFQRPADAVLREELTPLQYRVTRENGTEPPFDNVYWDNHEPGIYVDVISGEPLFASVDQFDSGTGWPSFVRPLVDGNVIEEKDGAFGRFGIEVRSRHADSHLGHVFNDGPEPTGLRYCINSAALRFVPADRLQAEGYGQFAVLFGQEDSAAMNGKTETAYLAGGCFWGMEDIIREIPGVKDTDVGYTGGTVKDATYPEVHEGKTGHAEAVKVVFDPSVLSYRDLLLWFFRMHDPTTLNRQGNDRGTSYRSAIFTLSEGQREIAEEVKAEIDAAGYYRDPVVTEITPAGEFYVAEDYHQDYLEKHPNGYTCHFLRDWDAEKADRTSN